MRKRRKLRRPSSDSSSDDETLISLVNRKQLKELVNTYNINPNHTLLQQSNQGCEFCDRKFNNKLEALMHNARHIIIPLLKQPFVTCSTCRQTFPSKHDAEEHMLEKHPEHIQSNETHCTVENRIQFEDDVVVLSDSEALSTNKLILGSKKVEKSDVLNSFTSNCIVNVEPLQLPSEVIELKKPEVNTTDEQLTFDLRQFNGIVINGLPDVVRESLSLCQPLDDPTVSIVLESSHSDEDVDEVYSSIPYSELTLPIYHKCEHCKKTFTNRFEVANHCVTHIRIRKPYPGVCIVCEHRPVQRYRSLPLCVNCGAKYNKSAPRVDTPVQQNVPANRDYRTKEKCSQLNLCDVCYVFKMKGRSEHVRRFGRSVEKYVLLETVKGDYRVCDNCAKTAYETRVVKCVTFQTWRDSRLANGIQFEEDKKPRISNVDRLKSMQKRLRSLNFMSRKSFNNVAVAKNYKSTKRWPIFHNPCNAWNT